MLRYGFVFVVRRALRGQGVRVALVDRAADLGAAIIDGRGRRVCILRQCCGRTLRKAPDVRQLVAISGKARCLWRTNALPSSTYAAPATGLGMGRRDDLRSAAVSSAENVRWRPCVTSTIGWMRGR